MIGGSEILSEKRVFLVVACLVAVMVIAALNIYARYSAWTLPPLNPVDTYKVTGLRSDSFLELSIYSAILLLGNVLLLAEPQLGLHPVIHYLVLTLDVIAGVIAAIYAFMAFGMFWAR